MSEERKPKKNPSEDEKSEHSDEEPRPDMSPDAAEDSCLLSSQPTAGAEALPVASANGACSSSTSTGLSSLFKKISPFKSKDSSKAAKPPCKKLKKESSFVKAKNAFRRTFRRSEPTIQGTDPDLEEKRRRKYSDPTHSKTKIEPGIESEPVNETEGETSKGFFSRFSGARSKKSKSKTKEHKTKEPKRKKEAKEKKKPKPMKARRRSTFDDSSSMSRTGASPGFQKKVLSPRSSYQPSIGAVSVGFFNEALQSESSGNPTESTSIDIKSGSSFSPDAVSSGRRHTITKRQWSFKETDEESSSE